MLNLIKKDLIITKCYIIKILAILMFYIFIFNKIDKQGIYVLSIYLIVYILISVSFFYGKGITEDYMLKSLPIKKKDVVLAKYTSVIIYFIASLILMYVISFIANILNLKDIIEYPQITTIFLSLSIIFLSMGIQLPIYFKFNHNKGKILNIIIYIAIFSAVSAIYDNNHLNNYITSHNVFNIYEKFILIITIISIILYISSAILSVIIYERKERI